MLEIIIENQGALNLPADIQVNFIEENPLFVSDRIPSPYTLSFEVPSTPFNLKTLGFPQRVTSLSVKKKSSAEIRHSGLVMAKGELIVLETEKTLKLQFKGSREPVEVNIPLNQMDLGTRDYGHFQTYPDNLNYQAPFIEQYITGMLQNAYTASDYVIAPVKIKGTIWDGPENKGGMVNTVKQYINYFNPVTKNFFIEDTLRAHTPILPFPFVYKLIDQVLGSFLESNPFATGDLAKLVFVSMNHKFYNFDNLYSSIHGSPPDFIPTDVMFPLVDDYETIENIGSIPVTPLKWNIGSFCQAITFRDILINLLKIFSMTAYPGVKYRLEFNNNVMEREVSVNWDDKLAGDPVISYEDSREYSFEYKNVKKSDTDSRNQLSSIKAIYDGAIELASESGKLYKNANTGALYFISRKLRGLDSLPWLSCEVKNSPLATLQPSGEKEKTEVISDIRPAEMGIEQYWWRDIANTNDVVQKKHWWIPVIDKMELSDPPHIMFWAGMASTFETDGSEYPLIMAHHTDHFGVKRLNTSLHPEGPDGLIEKYHSRMKAWTEKGKVRVKGSFRLTQLEIKRLDIRDKVHLRGRIFYIEKINYSLYHFGISLVDVDLIEC